VNVTAAASYHAERASTLLLGVEAAERELSELEPERELELAVSGGMARLNRNVEHTIRLAQAHALTAIAIARAEELAET